MRYLPEDLNPWVKYFALYIVFMKYEAAGRLQLKYDGARWRTRGKWRGNWWMEWVASTLHTTSEHGVSSINTADAAHLGCQ